MTEQEERANFCMQVRAALGADDIQVVDEVILLPIYSEKAKNYVQQKAGEKPDAEQEPVRSACYRDAVVYKTALLLIPYWRMQVKKVLQSPHLREENFDIDWTALEQMLQERLAEELSGAMDETAETVAGLCFFTVTNDDCCRRCLP